MIGDKCLGMLESIGEVHPDAKYQRCVVHFYCNMFSVVPRSKMKSVAKMLKAIHRQESKKAADKLEKGIEETLTYMAFPYEHWLKIRITNLVERINREIKRRTRVIGTFSDGNSALMLVCARLRHVTGTQWGVKRYMNMKHLENYSTEEAESENLAG